MESAPKLAKNEPPRKNYFLFDPTIHMGHILTIISIVGATFAAWIDLNNSVVAVRAENVLQQKEIDANKMANDKDIQVLSAEIKILASENKKEVAEMRQEMNGWFARILDKIDRKADKR